MDEVIEQCLAPFMPPPSDGQQQAQAEPEPQSYSDALYIGGHIREAEAFNAMLNALKLLRSIAKDSPVLMSPGVFLLCDAAIAKAEGEI